VGKRHHGKEQLRIDEARKWQAKVIEFADRGEEGTAAAMVWSVRHDRDRRRALGLQSVRLDDRPTFACETFGTWWR
jgi:hypothetical protein